MLNLGCLLAIYCSSAGLSHIFLSLCRNWKSGRVQSKMIVPNAAEDCRGPDLVEAVPSYLRWLAYRSAAAPTHLTERRLLRALDEFDAVYTFPSISLRTLQRIQLSGRPLFLERVNCYDGKTLPLLKEEYGRIRAEPERPFRKWDVDTERRLADLADFLFCPSPEVEKSFLEIGVPKEKLILTSYGWSPERFPHASVRKKPCEEVKILFAGDVCVRKGAHLLLRAWQRAGIKGRLILCGRMEPAIARACQDALDRADVSHVPYTPDIGPVYRDADIFAFPSLEEGGPLVTYEAMAHGLPVITSPMGAGSVARDGIDGMVIPPHDEDGWIEALRMFSRSAELRDHYGESARTRAGEFTWEKVAARRADAMLSRLGKPVSAPD